MTSTDTPWARTALVLAAGDGYAAYYREALEHAGIQFEMLAAVPTELAPYDVLLLCGYGKLEGAAHERVEDWVRAGGSLVLSGSAWSFDGALGLSGARHASTGTLAPTDDRLWPDGAVAARFFGGTVYAEGLASAATDSGEVAATRRRLGRGFVIYTAAHVGQTWSQMVLGRSVECDGIGARDGSANLDDGVLRAEDGMVLDFETDRLRVEDSSPVFAHPHADVVREMWIRAVLEAVEGSGRAAVLFWHWPNGAQATAMLTLDCETFDNDSIHKMQRLLSMHGVTAAWMVGQPGYPLDVYRMLRSWEHEVGLLFATDDANGWQEDKLKIQHVSLSRAASMPQVVAARATDGRWRGWTAFYEMCEEAGARLSVSKGGRQPGTSGFLFGTSHPYFPLRRDGTPYFVAEMPYSAFVPGRVTPDRCCDLFLVQAMARYGCFHLGARPESTADPVAADALRRVVALCRQLRLDWILPEQMYRFERGRRQLRVMMRGDTLQVSSPESSLEGLTLMVAGDSRAFTVKGRTLPTRTVERYGMRFQAVELNLEPKQMVDIALGTTLAAAA